MASAKEWVKSHKPQTAAIAVAAVVVICLVAAAACGAFSSPAASEAQDKPSTAQLSINVTADEGWDEESTPAIAHIEGDGVDFYHAINPDAEGNKGSSSVELAAGDYTVSLISPINRDGSAYELYDTGEAQDVAIGPGAESSVDFAMTLIAAQDVTDETVQEIVSQTKAAVENGDETLKGDAGRSALEKLELNAAANPNASDKTKEEAAKADEEVDVDSEPAPSTPSASDSASNGSDNGSNGGSGDSEASGGSSSGNASGGSSSNSGQASSHTHVWKDHTATREVWVSNMVTVPDYETQTISGAQLYTKHSDGQWYSDGAVYWFENGFTTSDLAAIIKDKIKNEGYIGNYVNVSKTETVQVGSHQEDQGWYETETYVDYQYCDCGARR